MAKMLDAIQMIRRGELPPPPVAGLIGITMASAEAGRVVMEMEVRP